jgi:hypothetical protein
MYKKNKLTIIKSIFYFDIILNSNWKRVSNRNLYMILVIFLIFSIFIKNIFPYKIIKVIKNNAY